MSPHDHHSAPETPDLPHRFEPPELPDPATSTSTLDSHSPRDEVLAGLGRRFQGPIVSLRFELQHSATRQIYRRDFVYVSHQLVALESSRRVAALPREALADALTALARESDRVQCRLRDLSGEMQALATAHGQGGSRAQVARPRVFNATIVSPYARDFLALLELADDALMQIERAWLLCLLAAEDRKARMIDCRKALQAFKEAVRDQRSRIGSLVREVNAARSSRVDRNVGDAGDVGNVCDVSNGGNPGNLPSFGIAGNFADVGRGGDVNDVAVVAPVGCLGNGGHVVEMGGAGDIGKVGPYRISPQESPERRGLSMG